MSSYRCHRPGNRARMMKRLGNRARMKARLTCTCIELGACMSSYRCHRPGNRARMMKRLGNRARMKTFSFRLGDLDGDDFVLELHQIELG